jgi:outer membrane receptor protein involved in Fe transport
LRLSFFLKVALLSTSVLVAEPGRDVAAQDTGPDPAAPAEAAVAVYPADFFAAYRPITLLDMLDRIPGVSLAFRQAEERRGLRTSTDQVLINGKQISAKDNNSLTVLRRISAAQVERIEVLRRAVADDLAPGSPALRSRFGESCPG